MKNRLSYTEHDSLSYLTAFFIIVALLGGLAFVIWQVVNAVRRLVQGL